MSNADEILKLKELLDNGLITKEEFEKEKIKLLSKNGKVENDNLKNNANKKKITGIGPGIVVIIIFVFFCIFMDSNDKRFNKIKSTVSEYVTSYSDFMDIVKDCGFQNYTVERFESLDNLDVDNSYCFILMQNGLSAYVYVKDKSIYSIKYGENYLYKDNEIKHTLSEYTVTSEEAYSLISKTKTRINSILKSPSTAEYPSVNEWGIGKKNGEIIVQGYVDSQNGFGAIVRSTFQVTYINDVVTSLIFDGKELIK